MALLCLVAIVVLMTLSQAVKAASGKGTKPRSRSRATAAPAARIAPVLGKTYEETLESGGLARTYLVYVPGAYDGRRAVPLLLALHGGGGQGSGMNKLTHLNKVADKEGFLIAYPDGIRKSWADGRETYSGRKRIDDVRFIADVIDAVSAKWKVDASRIYAAGISNGGFMAQRLACDLSDRIAAVGSVASTAAQKTADQCAPKRPVPVMFIFGTKDPLVPMSGGEVRFGAAGRIMSLNAAVQKWVDLNQCASTPAITDLPNVVDDGTFVVRSVYSGSDVNSEVVQYLIQGGGHTWPGGLQYLPEVLIGKTNRDIDASSVIWEFFKRHSLAQ